MSQEGGSFIDQTIEGNLEALALKDDFILEDKESLARYLMGKDGALQLISETINVLRREYPSAMFVVSYSDDNAPFVAIEMEDDYPLGERFWKLEELALEAHIKADKKGVALVVV